MEGTSMSPGKKARNGCTPGPCEEESQFNKQLALHLETEDSILLTSQAEERSENSEKQDIQERQSHSEDDTDRIKCFFSQVTPEPSPSKSGEQLASRQSQIRDSGRAELRSVCYPDTEQSSCVQGEGRDDGMGEGGFEEHGNEAGDMRWEGREEKEQTQQVTFCGLGLAEDGFGSGGAGRGDDIECLDVHSIDREAGWHQNMKRGEYDGIFAKGREKHSEDVVFFSQLGRLGQTEGISPDFHQLGNENLGVRYSDHRMKPEDRSLLMRDLHKYSYYDSRFPLTDRSKGSLFLTLNESEEQRCPKSDEMYFKIEDPMLQDQNFKDEFAKYQAIEQIPMIIESVRLANSERQSSLREGKMPFEGPELRREDLTFEVTQPHSFRCSSGQDHSSCHSKFQCLEQEFFNFKVYAKQTVEYILKMGQVNLQRRFEQSISDIYDSFARKLGRLGCKTATLASLVEKSSETHFKLKEHICTQQKLIQDLRAEMVRLKSSESVRTVSTEQYPKGFLPSKGPCCTSKNQVQQFKDMIDQMQHEMQKLDHENRRLRRSLGDLLGNEKENMKPGERTAYTTSSETAHLSIPGEQKSVNVPSITQASNLEKLLSQLLTQIDVLQPAVSSGLQKVQHGTSTGSKTWIKEENSGTPFRNGTNKGDAAVLSRSLESWSHRCQSKLPTANISEDLGLTNRYGLVCPEGLLNTSVTSSFTTTSGVLVGREGEVSQAMVSPNTRTLRETGGLPTLQSAYKGPLVYPCFSRVSSSHSHSVQTPVKLRPNLYKPN